MIFLESWKFLIRIFISLQHEAGKVVLEGCLSEDYYKVRELLYEQYAIVWSFGERILGVIVIHQMEINLLIK